MSCVATYYKSYIWPAATNFVALHPHQTKGEKAWPLWKPRVFQMKNINKRIIFDGDGPALNFICNWLRNVG